MFRVSISAVCPREQRYAVNLVLSRWLGITCEVKEHSAEYLLITYQDKQIMIRDTFFRRCSQAWLERETLPELPLSQFDLSRLPAAARPTLPEGITSIPVLFGRPEIRIDEQSVECEIDLLGSMFFMVSRYEEAVSEIKDEHDRVPAAASIAYKEGFLHRPVVNEYLELLWAFFSYLWPGIDRKPMQFRLLPTHDVDAPFDDALRSPSLMVRRAIGDVVKRKNPALMVDNISTWWKVRHGRVDLDRYNTFDFIAEESEKRSLPSAFYFLPSGSPEQRMKVSITVPLMQHLMRGLAQRGHEIGLHGHYETYRNKEALRSDAQLLRKVLEEIGVRQDSIGGRQHYLRWKTPDTFLAWEYAELQYDSTLSFADMPGFRCGTCYEYPVYDVSGRKELTLVERPLVVMECTVTDERYMGKGFGQDAFNVFKALKDTCRFYHGDYVLLWHNSKLLSEEQRALYLAVLDS